MFLRQVESQIEVEFEVEFEAEVGVDELDISRGGSVQSSVLLIVLQEQLRRLEGITAAEKGKFFPSRTSAAAAVALGERTNSSLQEEILLPSVDG